MVGLCISSHGGPPWLVEHLSSLDAAFSLPGGGLGGGRSLMTTISDAPTAQRVTTPLDPLTPLWQLTQLPAAPNLDDPDQELFRDGAILTAALQVGHAAETLDLAVAYAKEREQFGKPIGTLPGRQAHVRRHARAAPRWPAPRCMRRPAWPTRRTCWRRKPPAAGTTPFAWQQRAAAGAKLLGGRGGDHQRPGGDPGARRHGLHVGGAAAPAPQAVPRPRHHLRDVGRPLDPAGRPGATACRLMIGARP